MIDSGRMPAHKLHAPASVPCKQQQIENLLMLFSDEADSLSAASHGHARPCRRFAYRHLVTRKIAIIMITHSQLQVRGAILIWMLLLNTSNSISGFEKSMIDIAPKRYLPYGRKNTKFI